MQDKLEEMLRRQRAYAGYFHSRGDQVGTERGVVDCWLQARFKIPEEHYTKLEPRPNPLDPPDVVLTDMKGQRIGIEVTELVDGPTISAWVKGIKADFKLYEKEEFFSLIRQRIENKSRSEFKDPPYAGKVLVIYSDEPELCRDDFLAHQISISNLVHFMRFGLSCLRNRTSRVIPS
jgi:hypothetical protein